MKPRLIAIAAVAALIALTVWYATRGKDMPPVKSAGPPPAVVSVPPAVPEIPPPAMVPEPAAPKPVPPSSSTADRRDLSNPLAPASFPVSPQPRPAEADPDAAGDLDKVVLMFRDYRTIAGENPVGSNAEIMKSVMGDNPRGAKLGPPEGQTLNGEGELLDRWGTPYFFHQLSRDLMEIHSAGPDRKMGTDDDLMIK